MLNTAISFFCAAALALLSHSVPVFAQTKVVVVPLGEDGAKPLGNIVTVATENGQFSDPAAAVASITDASESNPYLVFVGPGVYNLSSQLVMKPFVNVSGSGPEATRFEGSVSTNSGAVISETAALVEMADNSQLSDLSVINSTMSADVVGGIALASGATAAVKNVNVFVEGGDALFGYAVTSGSTASISDTIVTANDSGATVSFGVYGIFNGAVFSLSDAQLEPFNGVVSGGTGSSANCGLVLLIPDNIRLDEDCAETP